MVQNEYVATSGAELGATAAPDRITVNEHYAIEQVAGFSFLVNAHDRSLSWSLRSVQEEIADLLPMAQGLVIDVGANVGAHSVAFCKRAQRVIAFEPQPHTYRILCANLAMNGCVNVEAHQVALGSREDRVLILPIDPDKDHASQGARVGGYGEAVRLATLDSFHFSPVSFLKIDVEEMELEVLQGARRLLTGQSPIVYVEIHTEQLVKEIVPFMKELGYDGQERIVQWTGEHETLTRGWLFNKPGRIAWV